MKKFTFFIMMLIVTTFICSSCQEPPKEKNDVIEGTTNNSSLFEDLKNNNYGNSNERTIVKATLREEDKKWIAERLEENENMNGMLKDILENNYENSQGKNTVIPLREEDKKRIAAKLGENENMNADAMTIYAAIIAFYLVSYLIGWLTAILQLPGTLIRNYYISKYYQIVIGVLSTLFQIYLLCSLPAYYYGETQNLTVAVISLILIVVYIIISIPKDNDHSAGLLYEDPISESVQIVNIYTRATTVVPIYILLCRIPYLIWKAPVSWFINACDWVLHIPVVGFIIKLFLGAFAGYCIIMALVGMGGLLYAGFIKIKDKIHDIKEKKQMNQKQHLPSPYPLNWFWFSVRFRYMFGPVLLLLTTLANYEILSTEMALAFVIDSCAALAFIALAVSILIEASRFTKLGLRLIYIYLYAITAWNVFYALLNVFLDTSDPGTHAMKAILYFIPLFLELKYYNKRKPLFIHEKNSNASYYFDPDLKRKHKAKISKVKNTNYEGTVDVQMSLLTEKIVDLLQECPSLSIDQIAARLGVPSDIIASIIGDETKIMPKKEPEPEPFKEVQTARDSTEEDYVRLDGNFSLHDALTLYKQGATEEEIEAVKRLSEKLQNHAEESK